MPNPSRQSIVVVTVTYNSADRLPGFLGSIDRITPDRPAVTVVENNSPQAAEAREIANQHGATFLDLDQNLGYGGAVNMAVRNLPESVTAILVSNPDVIVDSELVKSLSAWLDTHPGTGAVGPRILNSDGSVYPSARALPSLRTGIGHAVFARVWPNNPWSRRYRSDDFYTGQAREAGWLSGSCLLVRREAFDQLGGFDERYFMYFEDVDLGYRLKMAGWRSDYLPTVSAVHIGAQSTSSDPETMLRAHHTSALRYLTKKYGGWQYGPIRLVLKLGLAIRLRLEIMQSRRSADR